MRIRGARLFLAQAGYWGLYAVFASYAVALALSRGYPQSSSSLFVSVFLLCGFLGQFLWGSLSDRFRTNKKVFIGGICLTAACQAGMYFVHSPAFFLLFYAVFGLSIVPMSSVLDTWILRLTNFDMKGFGSIRGAGSLGYAVTMLLFGVFIDRFGYAVLIIAGTAFASLLILVAMITPDAMISGNDREKVSFRGILSIFRNKSFFFLLVILFLIGMTYKPTNKLKIMLYQSVGGSATHLGIDGFAGNVVQFLAYRSIGRFSRLSLRVNLLITTALMSLAAVINFVASAPWMIMAASIFAYTTYCFATTSARRSVKMSVPEKYQTTAISTADASFTISGALALTYAGQLAEGVSVRFMTGILSISSLCATAVMIVVTMAGTAGNKQ